MTRTLAAAGVAITLLAGTSADLSACGDKSLSAGGIRMQRALAARYPATVLIYAPSASRVPAATNELHFQQTLRKVGHSYREVSTSSDLQASLTSGQFNIVLADLADVPFVHQQLALSSRHAAVIAVAHKLTKAEAAEAAKLCRFLITAPSYAAQYLTTIADAVRSKSGLPRKS
jgi:hypothetical protein